MPSLGGLPTETKDAFIKTRSGSKVNKIPGLSAGICPHNNNQHTMTSGKTGQE